MAGEPDTQGEPTSFERQVHSKLSEIARTLRASNVIPGIEYQVKRGKYEVNFCMDNIVVVPITELLALGPDRQHYSFFTKGPVIRSIILVEDLGGRKKRAGSCINAEASNLAAEEMVLPYLRELAKEHDLKDVDFRRRGYNGPMLPRTRPISIFGSEL